jgi:UDP-N-acetylmuramoylalanine--D-glutamate ligase
MPWRPRCVRSRHPWCSSRVVAPRDWLIGESGADLEAAFRAAGLARTQRADTLEDAVRRGDTIARELLAQAPSGATATVLLSPAAASFDMFRDYEARGRAFKDAVRELMARRSGAGEGDA